MKRPIIIIISVIGIFLLLGMVATAMLGATTFSNQSRSLGYGGGGGGAPEVAMAPVMEEPAPAYDMAGDSVKSAELYNSASQAPLAQAPQERLVIENADLAIVVTNPKADMEKITRLANTLGGYVVSSNLYQSYTSMGMEVPEASIVVRIPAEKLDEALALIKKDAVDIQYENRSGQDVTNIYVDLQSQLKAKEAAEEQLLEIMEQAVRAEDVLAIYMQVQAVQTEIEQLKGQIQYYEESAALSSVSVRLIAEEAAQPIEIGPWKPEGAVKDAVEDLIRFVQNFVEFLIRFVIYVLPVLILIAIPFVLVFLVGRAIFRRVRKSKVSVEEKEIKSEK